MSAFNGVKVFCATMFQQRQTIGEEATEWLAAARKRPGFQLGDIVIRQSSDDAFHCVSVCIFYTEPLAKKRAA